MVIRIDNEKVSRIADYYGWDSQLRQLAEECCELSVESLHYIRERGATERLSEEIVDVLIMIQQIIYLLRDDVEKLEKYADFKLDRQLSRIKREQEQIQIAMFYDYDKKSKRVACYDRDVLLERVILYDKNIRL